MDFFIFVFSTTLHTLVYLFFVLAPFRKQMRFSPPVVAASIAAYVILSLSVFRFGFSSKSTIPYLYPTAMVFWVILTLCGCFFCIRANPLQLFFSIFVILDIQTLMIAFITVIRRVFFLPHISFSYDAEILSLLVLFFIFVPLLWILFIGLFQKVVESEIDFKNWRLLTIIPILHYIFDEVTGFGGIGRAGNFNIKDFVALLLNMTVIFATYFVSLSMLLKVNEGYRLEKHNMLMEQQIELQKGEYMRLAEGIKKDAQLRHDWRHQLRLLAGYATSGNVAALQEYLQDYTREYESEKDVVYCTHPTVDMLLHHFIAQAKKQGIETQICVQLPAEIGLSDSTLCIIFGNLLENAVEACSAQKSGPRTIDIQASIYGQQFVIFVKNSFDSPLLAGKEKGAFRSTKHEGDGIGLPSVRAVVEQNGGTFHIQTEAGVFSVNLLMNL